MDYNVYIQKFYFSLRGAEVMRDQRWRIHILCIHVVNTILLA